MSAREGWFLCRIKDPGQGFSLGEIHHAAINNPAYDPIRHAPFREAQGRRPGGYGVMLTRHLVDELVYSEKGKRSVVGQISSSIAVVHLKGLLYSSCVA